MSDFDDLEDIANRTKMSSGRKGMRVLSSTLTGAFLHGVALGFLAGIWLSIIVWALSR